MLPQKGYSLLHAVIFLIAVPTPTLVSAPVQLADLTVTQRVIIRVPLVRQLLPRSVREKAVRPAPSVEPEEEWEERKGPRCIAVRSIRHAAVTARHGVDLILSNGDRYRLRMEKICRSVDFYAGFYIEPSSDGSLCAGRDSIQSRAGSECQIDTFRRLVADK